MNGKFIAILVLVLAACQRHDTVKTEKSVEEIMNDSKISNSAIIRNPVSADEPLDTVNVARISFEESSFDFGEVNEGVVVTHRFRFTNTGKAPLLISGARSTCGCTVPEWPREPIPPGQGGEIKVQFNTENKKNKQNKPITIMANTYPSATKIFLTGYVRPKNEETTD